ncbi:hypothetical protein PsorP6_006689 [Peronosclerospora sorghi]|uniref:Uncharacterized protein n=1 Tax=Peronosclerospora sorghi TaxID=230839 RepID=A0ACC0W3X7_9STRA|nr:hypothetical protein PsorP6_006689 [Peronosclerospora sorghi]
MSETQLNLKLFSLNGSGRMDIEGAVKNSCNIMARRNDHYSKMCKKRLIKSMVKMRIVQPLEYLPPVKRQQINLPLRSLIQMLRRMSSRISCFATSRSASFGRLRSSNYHFRQPESFMKRVLKEICVYHRKDPNTSCYELNPQYKDGVSLKAFEFLSHNHSTSTTWEDLNMRRYIVAKDVATLNKIFDFS